MKLDVNDKITIYQIKRAMRDFYDVPENQAKFEEWLAKRKEKEKQNK